MLRAVVKNFLENLTEREFDPVLLALLSSQGFQDIHFIHGGFEFGKDVIAKRFDTGNQSMRQYSIQSKAGDLRQADWRAVRPQLEECEYNTRAHPAFDAHLPRVAVLVTTGRLKGSAAVDAQEFKDACTRRGLANFEVWDQDTIVGWLSREPTIGLQEVSVQDDLTALLSSISRQRITEPLLERHTRSWLDGDNSSTRLARASIETAIILYELRKAYRLDLAALVALHLYRAAWLPWHHEKEDIRSATSSTAVRLFVSVSTELLNQLEPMLDNPEGLAKSVSDIGYIFTYPALCSRLVETFSVLALSQSDGEIAARASAAVVKLATDHPGTVRPPAEQFAAAILPVTTVLLRFDEGTARRYLRNVSQWVLDRYDTVCDGLGLGSIDEEEFVQFERLVGGAMTFTSIEMRNSSYLAAVLLSSIRLGAFDDLYEAVLNNMNALRITITEFQADETRAQWRRGGPKVELQLRHSHGSRTLQGGAGYASDATAMDAIFLGSVVRNRHYVEAFEELARLG